MTRYSKSEIMKAAWEMHRQTVKDTRRWPEAARKAKLATSFSIALKIAWANAKAQATATKQGLENMLFTLKMKDRWNNEDFDLARELERKIAAA